jgi:DNA-binding Xre family transcriptional regulator
VYPLVNPQVTGKTGGEKMMDRNLLKSIMALKGINQKALCNAIGMQQPTFSRKLKKGVFGTDEAQKIATVLEMENPAAVFFAQEVAGEVTVKNT